MAQSFAIQFKLMLGDNNWVPVDQILGQSAALVDHYIQIADLHCCDFQGGFFIDIDGRPWNDQHTVDEFWMTTTWFPALKELLEGADTASAFPWEGTNLDLRRIGDLLELDSILANGRVILPTIQVILFDFVKQIGIEGQKFLLLTDQLRNEVARRRAAGVTAEIEGQLTEIEANLPNNLKSDLDTLDRLL